MPAFNRVGSVEPVPVIGMESPEPRLIYRHALASIGYNAYPGSTHSYSASIRNHDKKASPNAVIVTVQLVIDKIKFIL